MPNKFTIEIQDRDLTIFCPEVTEAIKGKFATLRVPNEDLKALINMSKRDCDTQRKIRRHTPVSYRRKARTFPEFPGLYLNYIQKGSFVSDGMIFYADQRLLNHLHLLPSIVLEVAS